MIIAIVIFVIIILIMWSGIFDFDSNNSEKSTPNSKERITSGQNNRYLGEIYFDIFVSEPQNGNYIILKVANNNFALVEFVNFPPHKSNKNQLLLEMDNRLYNMPEENLSHELGVFKISENRIKIYLADKQFYHNLNDEPFIYKSFEGVIKGKTLILDLKEKFFDQVSKSSKIKVLKERIIFYQL